jgi:CBS domain-containing protein
MKIRDILETKGEGFYAVHPNDYVFFALELMKENNIGAVLVIKDYDIVGIFSERDYARKVVLDNKSSKSTSVREIMSTSITTITPEDSIEHCLNLFNQKRIRHLPVLEDKQILGVVSIGDVVKAIIETQKETISFLDSYISGQSL